MHKCDVVPWLSSTDKTLSELAFMMRIQLLSVGTTRTVITIDLNLRVK